MLILLLLLVPLSAGAQPRLAATTEIGAREFRLNALPKGVVLREQLGIVAHASVDGQVVHVSRKDTLFETRATITPKGDFLLMFPEGMHYGHAKEKANDMIAIRSADKGRTWQEPAVAFAIDYNQHGFIPLVPRGSSRIYAFGTQPVFGLYTRERGLHENAPIGYRFSADDGFTWSEVEIIKPVNDPDFRGMSVMRMCETDRGTWLLGSHEADWSVKPLQTRLYILRSTDQGRTWTLLPGKRPGGWFVKDFNRMDEGRPVALGKGRVLFMMRTPEGRLWATWSRDDGRSWEEPKPTPLVHPDAPPMVFLLSDGLTLAAFHHNRYSMKKYEGLNTSAQVMKDRSEIWVAFSRDGGRTWTKPRFVFANALHPDLASAFRNYQCSYMDAIVDGGTVHLFVPHRWQRVLHLTVTEQNLMRLPVRELLGIDAP